MLQTIFEQKTALAAYATEHGGITMLTPNQIELTRKLIVALEPVEEITKMRSTDTASISVLIPLVNILQKALNKHDDDLDIQTMKTEILTSLERRFDDIEESELLLIATCLDPRFKDKFFSSEVKGLARKCVIDNIKLNHKVRDPVLNLLMILQLMLHQQAKFGSVSQKFCVIVEQPQIMTEERKLWLIDIFLNH